MLHRRSTPIQQLSNHPKSKTKKNIMQSFRSPFSTRRRRLSTFGENTACGLSKRKTLKLLQLALIICWVYVMQGFISPSSLSESDSYSSFIQNAKSISSLIDTIPTAADNGSSDKKLDSTQEHGDNTPAAQGEHQEKGRPIITKDDSEEKSDVDGEDKSEVQNESVDNDDKEDPIKKSDETNAKSEDRKPWTPPDDEGLDYDHLPPGTTGAFENCTSHTIKTSPPHSDQHNITLSCHTLSYRMPPVTSSEKIMIGVLSTASGDGPTRRQSIRETWAQNHSVFFLVAGPWEDISSEYETHQDLIWIDEEEIYDGEKSVLTFKTLAFVKVVYYIANNANLDIRYAFKTDDDSFINVEYLHKYLLEMEHEEEYNYWGWCQRKMFKPLRGENDKWAVSFETYPEPRYPRYCQGAGFALSWKLLSCAAGPGDHIDNARFMPFEDVAMGLCAQRCGIIPTMVADPRLIHMYRTDRTEERERVNKGLKKISKQKLPIPDMEGRIVQHRIYDAWDMREHYKQVLDPEGYKENTKIEWYYHEED